MSKQKNNFLKKINKIHFTGIKGVGMTALALCCKDLGKKITGSDVEETFVTDAVLKQAGIEWQVGFNKKHLEDTDLCIYTGAHGGEKNLEVIAAKDKQIPTMAHAQALGNLMQAKKGICVCGVGGKTTTTAMIATVFVSADLDSSYAIGVGKIPGLGLPGRYSVKSQYFITEADEYFTSPQDETPRFMYQDPQTIVLTNLEYDHPDVYKSFDHTIDAFIKFINKKSVEKLVVCIDNLNNKKLIKKNVINKNIKIISYGYSSEADYQITKHKQINKKNQFTIKSTGCQIDNIKLNLPGKYNVLNATAAAIVARENGIDKKLIKQGLEKFKGTQRRFELVKEFTDFCLYDDYAHHPMEIKKTLQAAENWFGNKKIVAIFQPHTYSRTKKLLDKFATSFNSADQVIVVDIYSSAREEKDYEISSNILAEKISNNCSNCRYLSGVKEVCDYLQKNDFTNTVIFTLGAGDIFLWHPRMIECLSNKNEY